MKRSTMKTALTAAVAPFALATAVAASGVDSATKVYPEADVNVTKDAFSATKKVEGALDTDNTVNGSDANVSAVKTAALMDTVGQPFLSADGEKLGTVTEVMMDARGNPEMVVDVSEYGILEGETVTLSMESDDIDLIDGMVQINISTADLAVKAKEAQKGKIII